MRSFPVVTSKAEKLPVFAVDVSPTANAAPMPPAEPATCEAFGICSNGRPGR